MTVAVQLGYLHVPVFETLYIPLWGHLFHWRNFLEILSLATPPPPSHGSEGCNQTELHGTPVTAEH